MDQALILKEILKCFCAFSGHKISVRKSNMYFSKGVDPSLCDQISQLFGFQKVTNLGSYLGVPVLYDRATKSTLNFVVEKVQISKGVCNGIGRIARYFIWGGSVGHLKTALVGWDFICQPKSHGGLGIRHLHDQNNYFLMKIGFNLVSLRMLYGFKFFTQNMVGKVSFLFLSIRVIALIFGDLSLRCGPYFVRILCGQLGMALQSGDGKILGYLDGSWNVDMLRIWLPDDMIRHVINTPPPHSAGGEDRIIWARSGSGSFFVRSAY
ncbi:uncharacterized protein [Gossypium hirsutum]|uniref:Reverse transcriptase n=1 Tax=Gossypium hirsutum TaxID=3635 RepID=A0A1U8PFZ2_GOSHI|nr:uncharacterized protein LOC107958783 [Gossypium hirsutum]